MTGSNADKIDECFEKLDCLVGECIRDLGVMHCENMHFADLTTENGTTVRITIEEVSETSVAYRIMAYDNAECGMRNFTTTVGEHHSDVCTPDAVKFRETIDFISTLFGLPKMP